MDKKPLRVMTYNIGGGRKDFGTSYKEVFKIIKDAKPDLLGVQECSTWINIDGDETNIAEEISRSSGFEENVFFGKTLSMRENFHPNKLIMVQGIYSDWIEWVQGNALFARYGFTKMSDPTQMGQGFNIPIYKPETYKGSRDTDARYAIIARTKFEGVDPLVVCTHFSTLLGERGGVFREIPGKSTEAEMVRYKQAKTLLKLLQPKLDERKPVIILGDFNATSDESCLSSVLINQGGFTRLEPQDELSTHPKVNKAVDHILVFPGEKTFDYSCWIIKPPESINASDHYPVVADLFFD